MVCLFSGKMSQLISTSVDVAMVLFVCVKCLCACVWCNVMKQSNGTWVLVKKEKNLSHNLTHTSICNLDYIFTFNANININPVHRFLRGLEKLLWTLL